MNDIADKIIKRMPAHHRGRWLGPDTATDARVLSTLNRQLPEHVKGDLVQNERNLPGRALPLVISGQRGKRYRIARRHGSATMLPLLSNLT